MLSSYYMKHRFGIRCFTHVVDLKLFYFHRVSPTNMKCWSFLFVQCSNCEVWMIHDRCMDEYMVCMVYGVYDHVHPWSLYGWVYGVYGVLCVRSCTPMIAVYISVKCVWCMVCTIMYTHDRCMYQCKVCMVYGVYDHVHSWSLYGWVYSVYGVWCVRSCTPMSALWMSTWCVWCMVCTIMYTHERFMDEYMVCMVCTNDRCIDEYMVCIVCTIMYTHDRCMDGCVVCTIRYTNGWVYGV